MFSWRLRAATSAVTASAFACSACVARSSARAISRRLASFADIDFILSAAAHALEVRILDEHAHTLEHQLAALHEAGDRPRHGALVDAVGHSLVGRRRRRAAAAAAAAAARGEPGSDDVARSAFAAAAASARDAFDADAGAASPAPPPSPTPAPPQVLAQSPGVQTAPPPAAPRARGPTARCHPRRCH